MVQNAVRRADIGVNEVHPARRYWQRVRRTFPHRRAADQPGGVFYLLSGIAVASLWNRKHGGGRFAITSGRRVEGREHFVAESYVCDVGVRRQGVGLKYRNRSFGLPVFPQCNGVLSVVGGDEWL